MMRETGPAEDLKKVASAIVKEGEIPPGVSTDNRGADEDVKLGSEKPLQHVPNEGPESVARPIVDGDDQKPKEPSSAQPIDNAPAPQQQQPIVPSAAPVAPAAEDQLQPKFFGADDMPEEMKRVAVEVARTALKKKTNKDRAEHIKKFFDKTYSGATATGGKWHCIVGTDFGSYVTHEASNFVFFQLGAYFVLVFKA